MPQPQSQIISSQPPELLKFVSNGLISGTRVYNAKTGVEIRGVKKISFEADAETEKVHACLELVDFTWEFITDASEAPAECHTCPHLPCRDIDRTSCPVDAEYMVELDVTAEATKDVGEISDEVKQLGLLARKIDNLEYILSRIESRLRLEAAA